MPRKSTFKAIVDNATTMVFKKNSFLKTSSFSVSLNNVQLAFDPYTLTHKILFEVNTTRRSGMLNKCKTVAIKFTRCHSNISLIYHKPLKECLPTKEKKV